MLFNRVLTLGRAGAVATAMLLATLVSGTTTSEAQQDPTAKRANDILRSLMPKAGATDIGRGNMARRIRIRTKTGQDLDVVADYRYQTDITVYFAYDSAELTDRARRDLRALGRALSSPELRPYRYMIAGHTDAKGSEEYNQELSMRRAEAVRDHLIDTYGVDDRRLIVTGWGYSQLKNPDNPYGAENRRTEVVLIADPSYAPNAQPMSDLPVPPFVRGVVPRYTGKGPCRPRPPGVPPGAKSIDDFGRGFQPNWCN